jgi:hypothetical protein
MTIPNIKGLIKGAKKSFFYCFKLQYSVFYVQSSDVHVCFTVVTGPINPAG